jgi:transcriptional regulator with XRE-family HTH domain
LREISARICELQARLGVSWRKFAGLAGLSEAHVRLAALNLEAGKDVTLSTLMAIADAAKVSTGWLISGEGAGAQLHDLPEWAAVEAEVASKYRDVPDFAVWIVGTFSMRNAPDRLDATTVRDLARAWFDASSDDLRSRVEVAYVDQRRGIKRPTRR